MNKKILILDDEKEYLVALESFLREFNYTIFTATSSRYALEVIEKDKPDLILFDYKLPDMDGDAFLKQVKAVYPPVPCILITAWNEPAMLNKLKGMGTADIMIKPIDLEELLKKIQKYIK